MQTIYNQPEFNEPAFISNIDEDQSSESSSLNKNSKKIKKISFTLKDGQGTQSKGKKHPWRPHEDAQVLELIKKHGQSWAIVAEELGNRTGKQVRDRYLNYLRSDIRSDDFTAEEDKLLVSLCNQFGNKWKKIASLMAGRTEGQVKNRYYVHIKKRLMVSEPSGKDVISMNQSPISSDEMSLSGSSNFEQEFQVKEEPKVFHPNVQANSYFPAFPVLQNQQTNNVIFSNNVQESRLRAPFGVKMEANAGQLNMQAFKSIESELFQIEKMQKFGELMRKKKALEYIYSNILKDMNELKTFDSCFPKLI